MAGANGRHRESKGPKGLNAKQTASKIAKLATLGATQDEVAWFFGLSRSTLWRVAAYREAYERGKANLCRSLRRKQVEAAYQGNATMLIWLGKQLLGQRDNIYLEGHVESTTVARSLSDEELERIARGGGKRAARQENRSDEPPSVH